MMILHLHSLQELLTHRILLPVLLLRLRWFLLMKSLHQPGFHRMIRNRQECS
jgi:hypothetical protein